MQSGEFMNAEEVARVLHLGKNTVYQLAKSGELASYHVGRKIRFTIEDVEAYIVSTHHSPTGEKPLPSQAAAEPEEGDELSQAAAFGELEGDPFVIAGDDIVADLLVSSLNASGMPAARLVHGSYTALVNLYAGDADAAVIHLYDQKTNSYNIPYARNLAPGVSVVVMRLYGREQGFIVQKGNPKNISSWGALLREGVHLSNRAKGTGSRVLLDEKLRAMDARSEQIEGYLSPAKVGSAAIKRVAAGLADVTIGTSREAKRIGGVDFIPMQTEWVDIVVMKTPRSRDYIRRLTELLTNEKFRQDVRVLAPCDLMRMGSIVYES